jgi:hypothetical protein
MLDFNDMLLSLETICRDGTKLREYVIESFSNNFSNIKLLDSELHFFSRVEMDFLLSQDIVFKHI